MEASVRITDHCVIQMGTSLGQRGDCTNVVLTAKMQADLELTFAQPHGNVYLADNGTVTADPYIAPIAVVPVQDPLTATILAPTFVPGTLTNAQRDQAIQALMKR